MIRSENALPAVDLRSDTVTKPTLAMIERMVRAELGDDGHGDDPTVIALEALAAERLGKEAGLFVPSGTMGNQVAILAHARGPGEVLAEATSHIFRSEMGGVATLAGLFHRGLPGHKGAIDLDRLAEMITPPGIGPKRLGTALVCMETTHNAAGGTVLPLEHMRSVQRLCTEHGVPLHLDGARLFNAAIALDVAASRIAACADTVTFCVSKGLSAPVGSVLTGSSDFIHRARGYRRMLGGNMRQSGLLAACGIVALEQQIDRLADDHVNARILAEGLQAVDRKLVDATAVETNIVMVEVTATGASAAQWIDALAGYGILAGPATRNVVRLVLNRHVSRADVDRAVAAFKDIYTERPTALFVA